MLKIIKPVMAVALVSLLGCAEEELVSPEVLDSTENIVATASGRLFVVGAPGLYELHEDASGQWQAEFVLQGQLGERGCLLSGMAVLEERLYIPCNAFDQPLSEFVLPTLPEETGLYVVDTSDGQFQVRQGTLPLPL